MSLCFLVNPPLEGTTVFGNSNGSAGTSLSELIIPWGITMNSDNSMLIADYANERVLRVSNNVSTGVIVASDVSLLLTRKAIFDESLVNLFVIDSVFCYIRRYYNGPLTFNKVFNSTCGTDLTQFGEAASFRMDSLGNFYIADYSNHRIMFWAVNATSGVLLAGVTGVSGGDGLHLCNPEDVTLDEEQGLLYVADTNNHRIIRYSLGSPNGIVVAGGNGQGVERK